MKILMTGATGLIGKSLGQKLVEQGHALVVISRDKIKAQRELPYPAKVIEWDLMKNPLPLEAFKEVEVVIHLLGETVDGRWTDSKKRKILESRQVSSKNLLLHLPLSVHTVISAAAQGIYGDRGDETLTEESAAGDGFLAEVCKVWEEPFLNLQKKSKNQRVVILRIGLVLTSRGGALAKLISLFQKNLGASLGSGLQWMSWISLRDLVDVFISAVENKKYEGVVNAVQPQPVQNKDFTKSLCQVLNVLQLPSVPSLVLKTLLGEMAALVLGSLKVEPRRLVSWGFVFRDTELEKFFATELASFQNGERLFYDEQYLKADIEKVFKFFADAGNLEKITPPLLKFHVKKVSSVDIEKGTLIDYDLKIHGVPAKWRTLIEVWEPPFRFVDTQLKGPYQKWHHTHSFRKFGEGTLMIDEVRYRLPLGALGRMVAGSFVESDVGQIFDYRRQIIAEQKF